MSADDQYTLVFTAHVPYVNTLFSFLFDFFYNNRVKSVQGYILKLNSNYITVHHFGLYPCAKHVLNTYKRYERTGSVKLRVN